MDVMDVGAVPSDLSDPSSWMRKFTVMSAFMPEIPSRIFSDAARPGGAMLKASFEDRRSTV